MAAHSKTKYAYASFEITTNWVSFNMYRLDQTHEFFSTNSRKLARKPQSTFTIEPNYQ